MRARTVNTISMFVNTSSSLSTDENSPSADYTVRRGIQSIPSSPRSLQRFDTIKKPRVPPIAQLKRSYKSVK